MKLEEAHRLAAAQPAKFQVIIDDNYHYMDDDARRHGGTFDTYEEALAVAQRLVIESVKECAEGKPDAGEILGSYAMFGEDPWILPTPEGMEKFSARAFAISVADELGAGRPTRSPSE